MSIQIAFLFNNICLYQDSYSNEDNRVSMPRQGLDFQRKIVIVCGYFRKLITGVVRGWLDGLLFLRDVAAPVPCYDGIHFKILLELHQRFVMSLSSSNSIDILYFAHSIFHISSKKILFYFLLYTPI